MFAVQGNPVKICFDQVLPNVLRVCMLPVHESARDVFSTIDLAERDWPEPVIATTQEGTFQVGDFTAVIENQTVTILKDGKQVQSLTIGAEGEGISFPLGESHLFGLGHGYSQHPDRRGGFYDLRVNGQVLAIILNGSATSPCPYLIGTEGWAMFFHQPWKANIDLTGEVGKFTTQALFPNEYADIFVVSCPSLPDAPGAYYSLTGLPPMPPRYAFGYQQSYRTLSYKGENEVMKTAKYMREHDLPCDVLIYLGSGYCEHGWNTYNGNFDFDKEAFPTPEKTMQDLHEMGYKVSLHVTRCYTGLHGSVNDEGVSPLEYDHAKNYWKVHEKLYKQTKNEVWWPDDADEVDMEQRLARHRMYYEGSLKINPDIRPFQMQRNAFPGHTKWGGIIWTGDVLSEWATLKNSVPIGLNASVSCSPYWGTDTGGFYSTIEYTGELWLRWFEFSAFTPFFRGHGRPSYLHNPWGWNRTNWDEIPMESAPTFPRDNPPPKDALPDPRVEPICRKYLHERYALLPMFYTLSHEVWKKGTPMMRPLWMYWPEDPVAATMGSEYLLGENLLVAPVTEKSAETWKVYLPAGKWLNYWTAEAYEGAQWVEVPAALDTIPLFVKAGGMIPKGPVTQSISAEKKDTFEDLSIVVYPGQDGRYELYEDDGISLGYQRNENTVTTFTWNEKARTLTAEGVSTLFPGRKREIAWRVMGTDEAGTVTVQY